MVGRGGGGKPKKIPRPMPASKRTMGASATGMPPVMPKRVPMDRAKQQASDAEFMRKYAAEKKKPSASGKAPGTERYASMKPMTKF